MSKRVKIICPECASDELYLSDVTGYWDTDTQRAEISDYLITDWNCTICDWQGEPTEVELSALPAYPPPSHLENEIQNYAHAAYGAYTDAEGHTRIGEVPSKAGKGANPDEGPQEMVRVVGPWKNFAEVRKAHKGEWFDGDIRGFYRTHFEPAPFGVILDGRFFITSDVFDTDDRTFTVWAICDDATILSVFGKGAFLDYQSARQRLAETCNRSVMEKIPLIN